jgi:hypothetical protein
MSIAILIDQRTSQGDLFRFTPLDYASPIKRLLYLSKELNEFVNDVNNVRAGKLLAQLESFVAGERILVSVIPRGAKKKARDARMGLLGPVENGIWDFRSRDKPGLRLFGGFTKKDCLVLLNMDVRARMNETEWKEDIRICDQKWANLFTTANLPMYIGENPSDYLSNCVCLD